MNELAELSSLRAEVAAAQQQGLARPRELLQAEIRAARERGPGFRAGDGARSARARHPWQRAFPPHVPGTRRAVSPWRAAWLAGGAAAAAAVAVTAGLLTAPGQQVARPRPGRSTAIPAGTTDTVAYVLDRAAAAATGARRPAPRPGQYISMSSVTTQMGARGGAGGQITGSWLTTSRRQIWLPVSGRSPGALRIHWQAAERLPWGGAPPHLPGRRLLWRPEPASTCPARTRGTYPYLTSLPTPPTQLREWIYAHLDGGKIAAGEQAWKEITSLLGTMPVPPKLASALFRVAATIPGATVVQHATDAAGRDGIAVGRLEQAAHANVELIFDRASYHFLGERSVLAAPVAGVGPAGTVIGSTAQLSVTVTDRLPFHAPAFPQPGSNSGATASC